MYYAGLKKLVGSLEEKAFYDVALVFLRAIGYGDATIIDGTGDGGRDVESKARPDLRIQLSVRKDWVVKINEEAEKTRTAKKKHFIYVTNRFISSDNEEAFRDKSFKLKGEVEVTIYSLNQIASRLALPQHAPSAFAAAGIVVGHQIKATYKEVALSSVLLFSPEANDLRESTIESLILASLLKKAGRPDQELRGEILAGLPGVGYELFIDRVLGRLKGDGRVQRRDEALFLRDDEATRLQACELEFHLSLEVDIRRLMDRFRMSRADAEHLTKQAVKLSAKQQKLEGDGVIADEIASFVANRGWNAQRAAIYEELSKVSVSRVERLGGAIDRLFSTSTFDIYRALGKNANVTVLLDSNVAIPLLIELEFGATGSGYGMSATALSKLCQEHGFEVVVPSFYINEVAGHGYGALDIMDTYPALPAEAHEVLKNSKNAYLSHYSRLKARGEDVPSPTDFLRTFGIRKGGPIRTAENVITSIFTRHGFKEMTYSKMDEGIRERIRSQRKHAADYVVDHDAMAVTLLRNESEKAFVCATWDRVLMVEVEGISRVMADTPTRVVDFLSMSTGLGLEADQDWDLLTALVHVDEKKASALADKIEKIRTTEQAYKLGALIEEARIAGRAEALTEADVDAVLEEPSSQPST